MKVFVAPDPEDDRKRDRELLVFGPGESETGWDSGKSRQANRMNACAIDAARDPDRFTAVMQNWLERDADPDRKRANDQFFACLPGTPIELALEVPARPMLFASGGTLGN